jgi:hypothetical protein
VQIKGSKSKVYRIWAANMASMQQRKDEILAKKAKLAELKRQRELRNRDVSSSRQSIGGSSDVCASPYHYMHSPDFYSLYLLHLQETTTTGRSWMI